MGIPENEHLAQQFADAPTEQAAQIVHKHLDALGLGDDGQPAKEQAAAERQQAAAAKPAAEARKEPPAGRSAGRRHTG